MANFSGIGGWEINDVSAVHVDDVQVSIGSNNALLNENDEEYMFVVGDGNIVGAISAGYDGTSAVGHQVVYGSNNDVSGCYDFIHGFDNSAVFHDMNETDWNGSTSNIVFGSQNMLDNSYLTEVHGSFNELVTEPDDCFWKLYVNGFNNKLYNGSYDTFIFGDNNELIINNDAPYIHDSVIFGYKNQFELTADSTFTFGYNNYIIGGNYSVVFGSQNTVNNNYCTVFGRDSSAYSGSFTQGFANTACNHSIAQGNLNKANEKSIAQGWNNTANSGSIANGWDSYASGFSLTVGNHNSATYLSVAVGVNNSAEDYSISQGFENSSTCGSIAIGENCLATYYSFAYGDANTATEESVALIEMNSACEYSLAAGFVNSATTGSYAFGCNNSASNSAAAVGTCNYATSGGQAFGFGTMISGGMAIGKFNNTSADVAFVIGNGTGTFNALYSEFNNVVRSDAFKVDYAGNVSAAGNISAANIATSNIADLESVITGIQSDIGDIETALNVIINGSN